MANKLELQSLANQAAAKYGLPPGIFSRMIHQESGWQPQVVSSAGAQGLGQLMPGTARALGVKDPFDPAQNLDGAARYLKQQYDRFGDWSLALAAYNAGPGAVTKAGNQIPHIPETQNYVQSIMGGQRTQGAGTGSGSGPTVPALPAVNPVEAQIAASFAARGTGATEPVSTEGKIANSFASLLSSSPPTQRVADSRQSLPNQAQDEHPITPAEYDQLVQAAGGPNEAPSSPPDPRTQQYLDLKDRWTSLLAPSFHSQGGLDSSSSSPQDDYNRAGGIAGKLAAAKVFGAPLPDTVPWEVAKDRNLNAIWNDLTQNPTQPTGPFVGPPLPGSTPPGQEPGTPSSPIVIDLGAVTVPTVPLPSATQETAPPTAPAVSPPLQAQLPVMTQGGDLITPSQLRTGEYYQTADTSSVAAPMRHPAGQDESTNNPIDTQVQQITNQATGPLASAINSYAQQTGGRNYVKDLVIRYAAAPTPETQEAVLQEAQSYGIRSNVQFLGQVFGRGAQRSSSPASSPAPAAATSPLSNPFASLLGAAATPAAPGPYQGASAPGPYSLPYNPTTG